MIKCGKCGKKLKRETSCVNPVDKNGRNSERIPLCLECHTLWHETYAKLSDKDKNIIVSKNFFEEWAMKWENFLSGKYDVEKVQFT